ncbi:Cyclohexanone monooxygenase [Pseudomonas chlororaphis]|uniref:Cyclohexanone monooxygenase n=1 Tax=Pseudomonas chlororaphis TaxID=587753 RepID=A0A3G7TMB9_9PSED|nr:Cyclohexanone monooxygenase [Pseudomonas chlororaphis]
MAILTPDHTEADGVRLYLHGGAFCLGGSATHRSVTRRLDDRGEPCADAVAAAAVMDVAALDG